VSLVKQAIAAPAHEARPHAMDLLHVDDDIIVVVKPSGLPSVPGRPEHLRDCVASRLQTRFGDVLTVHRIDMATSGLMLFARGKLAQRRLSGAFAAREVVKGYVAVVHGLVAPDNGEIDLPLCTDWPNRPRQRVDPERGKPSLTRFQVLSRDDRGVTTRLALQPMTGRSHQLRVHLHALAHPILGDRLYAPEPVQALAPRLLLHANRLGFPHPLHGEWLQFDIDTPF
jgi:tRNA pseudouridine32 synthase/23S rRNA pseudouridine746 synthase